MPDWASWRLKLDRMRSDLAVTEYREAIWNAELGFLKENRYADSSGPTMNVGAGNSPIPADVSCDPLVQRDVVCVLYRLRRTASFLLHRRWHDICRHPYSLLHVPDWDCFHMRHYSTHQLQELLAKSGFHTVTLQVRSVCDSPVAFAKLLNSSTTACSYSTSVEQDERPGKRRAVIVWHLWKNP